MSQPPAATGRLPYEPAIDGLRGVSVLAVLIFHACALADRADWMRGGFLGVSVFFVISGYLMISLVVTERDRTGRVDGVAFAARRVRRLAAASLVVVALVTMLSLVSFGEDAWGFEEGDAVAGALGFSNWRLLVSDTNLIGPLVPFWSLAVELQFYAGLALAVVLLGRTRHFRRWLAVLLGCGWLVSAAVQLIGVGSANRREFGTDSRLAELAAGGLLALAAPWLLARFSRRSNALTIAGVLATAAMVAGYLLARLDPPWLLRGGYLVVSIVGALLLFTALNSPLWRRWWSARPLVAVGKVSYSLYLVHWPIGLLIAHHLDRDGIVAIAANLAASTLVALLLYQFVEQPTRQLRWSPRRTLSTGLGAALAVSAFAVLTLT